MENCSFYHLSFDIKFYIGNGGSFLRARKYTTQWMLEENQEYKKHYSYAEIIKCSKCSNVAMHNFMLVFR